MKIGITARIRNGHMLAWRERFGLNQRQAAELVEINPTTWNALELLHFNRRMLSWKTIRKIAVAVGCEPDEIGPPELIGKDLSVKRTKYLEVETRALLGACKPIALLPSDSEHQESVTDGDMLKDRVEEVLKTLTYREREIIKLRYGIGDGYTYTLEEVGKIFKVTRDRIRQVEAKAIRKLQRPVRARKLEGFIEQLEQSV